MHDAMQTYWSRFANTAQWAFWTFFASLHEMGTSLGGIMFDEIGPNQRQGCAIFNDSFTSDPPPGDANPPAWMQRNLFWTACHEMGHAFNLAHSWQKSWGRPWIPLADEPEARSFMNYPYRVSGGQTAFFADFQFRFSDEELLFLRHAPARFVQPGNADWFDHHGFREANVSPEPALKMELRVNREKLLFEFMEPVILELKLTNISLRPQLIDHNLWSVADSVTVIIKKDDKPARQFVPYAQYYWLPDKKVLMPGESIYEPNVRKVFLALPVLLALGAAAHVASAQYPRLRAERILFGALLPPLQHAAGLIVREDRSLFYGFAFEDPAVLQPLREAFELDRVAADAPIDLDRHIALMHWVRDRFPHGVPKVPPDPDAFDGLAVLRAHSGGGYLCGTASQLLVQAISSLGGRARRVDLRFTPADSHVVTEAWSERWRKWIVLDPDYDVYFTPARRRDHAQRRSNRQRALAQGPDHPQGRPGKDDHEGVTGEGSGAARGAGKEREQERGPGAGDDSARETPRDGGAHRFLAFAMPPV